MGQYRINCIAIVALSLLLTAYLLSGELLIHLNSGLDGVGSLTMSMRAITRCSVNETETFQYRYTVYSQFGGFLNICLVLLVGKIVADCITHKLYKKGMRSRLELSAKILLILAIGLSAFIIVLGIVVLGALSFLIFGYSFTEAFQRSVGSIVAREVAMPPSTLSLIMEFFILMVAYIRYVLLLISIHIFTLDISANYSIPQEPYQTSFLPGWRHSYSIKS